jgi:hypothetical protein
LTDREAATLTGERYAVLFKAFTNDAFVKRRLAHVVNAAPSGDVYLMIDETNQPGGPIAFDRVIRYREADLVRIGFPHISEGALFWYNADYPLYYFRHLHPEYDTIVTVEYDAVPNVDLDDLVEQFRAQDLDLVGRTITNKTPDTYWWTNTMLHFYSMDQVRPYQICATITSARAIDHLGATRKRHAATGITDPRQWPIGETFVGTELFASGFKTRDLADFGKLTRYDWWPPIHERELKRCADEVFVHPVLSGRRYVKSLFKSNFRSGVIVSAKLAIGALARMVQRPIPAVAAEDVSAFDELAGDPEGESLVEGGSTSS